jgi:hypothetical protein
MTKQEEKDVNNLFRTAFDALSKYIVGFNSFDLVQIFILNVKQKVLLVVKISVRHLVPFRRNLHYTEKCKVTIFL